MQGSHVLENKSFHSAVLSFSVTPLQAHVGPQTCHPILLGIGQDRGCQLDGGGKGGCCGEYGSMACRIYAQRT